MANTKGMDALRRIMNNMIVLVSHFIPNNIMPFIRCSTVKTFQVLKLRISYDFGAVQTQKLRTTVPQRSMRKKWANPITTILKVQTFYNPITLS